MSEARDDAEAGRITWSEFRDLRDELHRTGVENSAKARRLTRTIKLLEKRSERLKKTAARTPKQCRGNETEQLWIPGATDGR